MNPEKVQLIQPPITIMGSMLVNIPFIMSNAMLGSVGGERENIVHVRDEHIQLNMTNQRAAFSIYTGSIHVQEHIRTGG